MPAPLIAAEITALAVGIRALLNDTDFCMATTSRHRWEGALAAVEFVLGEAPTLALGGRRRLADG